MIPVAQPWIGKEELDNVTEAVKSGWVSSKGEFIGAFEKKFAEYFGTSHGISTSSGTAALHMALLALGVKPGDEVIVPSLTFIATANTAVHCGATPVFVDSHPEYWCMDPEKLEQAITEKTKAIVPVHVYGHPCDMDPIMEISEKHSIPIVEDCAQAHGATYKKKRIGSFGTINCFSLFGNKMITTGEGGMCLTNNAELDDKLRMLRDHGMVRTKEYRHVVMGYNYRMTNLQAALGIAQLGKIDRIISEKNTIVAQYNALLSGVATLPPKMEWAEPTCWMYTALVNNRDQVITALKDQEIETRPLLLPIHKQPIYPTSLTLPVSESLYEKGISLPTFVGLKSEEIKQICDIVIQTAQNKGI